MISSPPLPAHAAWPLHARETSLGPKNTLQTDLAHGQSIPCFTVPGGSHRRSLLQDYTSLIFLKVCIHIRWCSHLYILPKGVFSFKKHLLLDLCC
jgi:hypothetical protein